MRILVTGAGGFVGSHITEELIRCTDSQVIAVDSFRHNGSTDRVSFSLSPKAYGRVGVLVHDLRAPFSRAQQARLGQVDAVINAASRCQVDESIADPVDFVRNNVDLMLNVLEFARDKKIPRVVHVSTDEVYGPGSPQSLQAHAPSSPYAASKAAQEDICHAYRRTFGVPVTIVNSANMFGERQSQLAFIPRIMRALLRDETLKIHYHCGVPGIRHYTYVRNVASEIVTLLGVEDPPARVVLPGQRSVTNLSLALQVADLLGSDLRYEVVDVLAVRPGYDPQYAPLSGHSWKPSIDFDDGLRRTVQYFAANPDALES